MVVSDPTTLTQFRADGYRIWRLRNLFQQHVVVRSQDYGYLAASYTAFNNPLGAYAAAVTAAAFARVAFPTLAIEEAE